MSKEYTGAEFEIEFARAWLAYVEGGKVGVDPRTQWEVKSEGSWFSANIAPSFTSPVDVLRWKPIPKRKISIGYFDGSFWVKKKLVAPEVEAPPIGSVYFWLSHGMFHWNGDNVDMTRLSRGEVFLSLEDMCAMAEWLSVCRKGGAA